MERSPKSGEEVSVSLLYSRTMDRLNKLSEAVDFGINSTYLHAHMPKINSSSVKICESSRPRLAQKFSIVTRAVCVAHAPTKPPENNENTEDTIRWNKITALRMNRVERDDDGIY